MRRSSRTTKIGDYGTLISHCLESFRSSISTNNWNCSQPYRNFERKEKTKKEIKSPVHWTPLAMEMIVTNYKKEEQKRQSQQNVCETRVNANHSLKKFSTPHSQNFCYGPQIK